MALCLFPSTPSVRRFLPRLRRRLDVAADWAVGQAAGPLEPFRYIPLILGLISCTIGILLFLFLAESPLDVRWLTPRESAATDMHLPYIAYPSQR